jgi:hypothetical protein
MAVISIVGAKTMSLSNRLMVGDASRFLASDLTAEDWQRFEKFLDARREAVRKGQTYVVDIIAVLWPHHVSGLHRLDVIERVYQLRVRKGLTVTPKFADTVQSTFNKHNFSSATCKKRYRAPFYTVARGVWGINRKRGLLWLEERQLDPHTSPPLE